MKRVDFALVIVGLATCCGCASVALPPVPMRPGASAVRVLTDRAELEESCIPLRGVRASDGKVGSPGAFKGSRDRAIQKLQNAAALAGADTIAIDESDTLATVAFEGAPGREITLQAVAYRCASSED